jgi:hypothetical protein
MICWSYNCTAQSRDLLPRIGTIKDYPATGLMTGCANLYFYPASEGRESAAAYVFLAHGDGSNAWMNLGGRDVRLRQIRSLTQESGKPQRYYYRLGKLRINVVIEKFKHKSGAVDNGDPMFTMKIILRQGRALRIVRARGSADC